MDLHTLNTYMKKSKTREKEIINFELNQKIINNQEGIENSYSIDFVKYIVQTS